MLASGLPELKTMESVDFVKNKFHLGLDDKQAAALFEQKIQENRGMPFLAILNHVVLCSLSEAKTIQLNHTFHVVYHGMRSKVQKKKKKKNDQSEMTEGGASGDS